MKTAFGGVRTNKARSALTILGIVIGVTAIIMIMSIGEGAQELILGQIRGIGSRTIIVEPGREPQGPSDIAQIFTDSLKDREVLAISNPGNVMGKNQVVPNVIAPSSLSFENETKRVNVIGTSNLWMEVMSIAPSEGGIFFRGRYQTSRSSGNYRL
ncbi:ABC transporter permease [Candidatus Peregrinibacteria bacterium]|nr:ABC transporter permease [Candidatus Peregrinibacteria bacterium]